MSPRTSTLPDLFRQRVESHGRSLGAAGKRVVEYIARNRGAALAGSAIDIAKATNTSDATVVRAVQALGFAGLGDLKRSLADSVDVLSTPAKNMHRTLEEVGESAELAIETVLKTHGQALTRLQRPFPRKRILAAVVTLQKAERIVLFGIGPSGFLANYTAMHLQRAGYRTKVLDSTGLMLADQLLDLHVGDALLAIAYDPPYPEIMAVFSEAKRLGLETVLVTNGDKRSLASFADIVVPVMRGRAERVALHGTTVICLEALVLSLAATNSSQAESSLARLGKLRQQVTSFSRDVTNSNG